MVMLLNNCTNEIKLVISLKCNSLTINQKLILERTSQLDFYNFLKIKFISKHQNNVLTLEVGMKIQLYNKHKLVISADDTDNEITFIIKSVSQL